MSPLLLFGPLCYECNRVDSNRGDNFGLHGIWFSLCLLLLPITLAHIFVAIHRFCLQNIFMISRFILWVMTVTEGTLFYDQVILTWLKLVIIFLKNSVVLYGQLYFLKGTSVVPSIKEWCWKLHLTSGTSTNIVCVTEGTKIRGTDVNGLKFWFVNFLNAHEYGL